jgi:choline dehydrogenase-like flavoprotein
MILEAPPEREYELIVIGSGPAGLAVATTHARIAPRARTLIVESGGLKPWMASALPKVVASGDLPSRHYQRHSQRELGGTSGIWHGFCAVMERRAFTAGEWPIDYEDLAAWYPDAASLLDLPSASYQIPEIPVPGSTNLVYKPYYMSPPTRFGPKYQPWLEESKQVDLLPLHTVIGFDINGRSIQRVEARDTTAAHTRSISLTAERVVVACGGIGSPRLLLLAGIASESPVGTHLMDHPHTYKAFSFSIDKNALMQVLPPVEHHTVHGFQLSSAFCEQQGLLSTTFGLVGDREQSEHLMGRQRTTLVGTATIRGEMNALRDNYVRLSDTHRDKIGQPLAEVNLSFSHEAIRSGHGAFSRELLLDGIGRPGELSTPIQPTGGGHLMGTTRMGVSAADSVVDRNCRIHTLDNCYVAGSSVFPASGAANPTMSLVALAVRLGHHLASAS